MVSRAELLKPPAVRPGDCAGIVSPSSPVPAVELDRLAGYLRSHGYGVRLAGSGAILLIEAKTATFGQADSALTQMRLAGVFDQIAAVVVGAPVDWAAP